MKRKYVIETFGCQMNVHDSDRMAGLLDAAGFEAAADATDADVVVINTCSVRERAEEKLYTRLGELRVDAEQTGRRRIIAVAGCVAQQEGHSLFHRSRLVDVIVGTQSILQLPSLIARATDEWSRSPVVDIELHDTVSFPFGLTRRSDSVRAQVTIIEGCNDFCAFCVVPYTRGRERMRPATEILEEVRLLADSGFKEIQLLGQIVNHYQAPDRSECDFPELLSLVHEVSGIERIRFASPHPRHVTRRLIEAMRDLPKVCKHLHLPVQSGSTAVLQRMRRRYSREWYLELVGALRSQLPDLSISTDMIVGFPGETADDFNETLSLTETVRFSSMFSFKYSPRPQTLADKRMPDDVSEEEKTGRIVTLQDTQRRIQLERHERAVGSRVLVLADAFSKRHEGQVSGRTTGNAVVNFPGDEQLIGQFVTVRIERAGPNSLWGRVDEPTLDSQHTPAYV
ncbi:MAG: tRNA (N6-isopentenyl adenosine(37)-C2)-methylthiotransferase MiaB [Vicinamibacterales bacterium]